LKLLLVETTQYAPASPLFIEAARSMPGVELSFVDENEYFAPIARSLPHRLLYRLLARRPPRLFGFERHLLDTAEQVRPDVVLVVKGPYVRPQILQRLRRLGAAVVNFSTDDPFNSAAKFPYLRDAIREYDLYVTPRTANIAQLQEAGARRTMLVPFAYKPSVHYFQPEEPQGARDACDLLFIGGADADRTAFFRRVVDLWPDVRLDLYGNYWDRDSQLRAFWRGYAFGDLYRSATRRAKLAINLVRHGNRDGHVMRTFEVPACGGCMLAERTDDHARFFEEGREALFFDTPESLVREARAVLDDDDRRTGIALAGHRRVVRDGHTYAARLEAILAGI
jgi:hypothetical protein